MKAHPFMKFVGAAAVAVVLGAGAFIVGCSDDDDKGGGGGGSCSGPIVLPGGQAWTDAHEYDVGSRDGIIFASNCVVQLINDYSGTWRVDESGTYSLSGNTINVNFSGDRFTSTYVIEDNMLILDGDEEFVKTSNVTVGGSNANSTPLAKTVAEVSEDGKKQSPFRSR